MLEIVIEICSSGRDMASTSMVSRSLVVVNRAQWCEIHNLALSWWVGGSSATRVPFWLKPFLAQTTHCSHVCRGFGLFFLVHFPVVSVLFFSVPIMSQPRRSAGIAARQAQNQLIPLDDAASFLRHHDARCVTSLLPVEHLCMFLVAIIPHTDFVLMTEWTRCVRIVRWIFVKCLAEVIIVVLCVGILVSRIPTQLCSFAARGQHSM